MYQALVETIFDVVYLSFAMITGILLVSKGKNTLIKLVGWMTFLLGFGDAFHLVPRMYALWTNGLEANATALGIGKLITSITMTVFYLLLYYIWRIYFKVEDKKSLTFVMWGLAIVRIVLCLFPQNEWLNYQQPVDFGIYRNIPFAIIGILIIWIFASEVKKTQDKVFKHLPLAVILSFGFYLPVVLWGSSIPALGALMIPKTLAYVWVIFMGLSLYRQTQKG